MSLDNRPELHFSFWPIKLLAKGSPAIFAAIVLVVIVAFLFTR